MARTVYCVCALHTYTHMRWLLSFSLEFLHLPEMLLWWEEKLRAIDSMVCMLRVEPLLKSKFHYLEQARKMTPRRKDCWERKLIFFVCLSWIGGGRRNLQIVEGNLAVQWVHHNPCVKADESRRFRLPWLTPCSNSSEYFHYYCYYDQFCPGLAEVGWASPCFARELQIMHLKQRSLEWR